MSGEVIGWIVAAAAGFGFAWLVCLVTRSWGRLRYLPGCVVLACSLTPFGFDGEHHAPAFAVATFRLFLEDGLDPGPPLLAMGAVTLAVVSIYLAVVGIRVLIGSKWR